VILIHQRYRRTDRQTDGRTDGPTTCNLNTALCTSASRGNKMLSLQKHWLSNQEAIGSDFSNGGEAIRSREMSRSVAPHFNESINQSDTTHVRVFWNNLSGIFLPYFFAVDWLIDWLTDVSRPASRVWPESWHHRHPLGHARLFTPDSCALAEWYKRRHTNGHD